MEAWLQGPLSLGLDLRSRGNTEHDCCPPVPPMPVVSYRRKRSAVYQETELFEELCQLNTQSGTDALQSSFA